MIYSDKDITLYANTIYEGKYYRLELKIVKETEITKEEYYNTMEKVNDYDK